MQAEMANNAWNTTTFDQTDDSGATSTSSQDSSDADEYVDGGNERHVSEQLSSRPPLVLISSTVKKFKALVKLANPGVAVIHYNFHSTTLDRLLQYIGDRLMGRKAYSICFVTQGRNPGNFKLISHKTVSLASLTEDSELRGFFTDLVSCYLHTSSDLARIDVLNSPVEENAEGKQLVQTLSKLVGVPVNTSKDIWGKELSSNKEDGPIKIGTLYFDGQRLKEWYAADNEMKLDKYEKIRVVGQGAYGQAVLYRRKDDDSKVILKKIRLLELKKEERQNVLTEIRVLSRLDHPHIVSYYDSFEEKGEMMIEMEYAEGGSLQQYLKEPPVSPLPELVVLSKFSQMVDAIRYVHMHNILHRDLKTANIFLTRSGSIKLGDFGIAKVLSATHEAAHSVVGTPYYISPEICQAKQYDTKSDIWSLGCILYEMLCLRKTFDGTNLPALVHKIVEGSFQPINGSYSTGLKRLVKKMLKKEPSDRPSAEELHHKIVPELLKPIQKKELPPLPSDLLIQDDANTRSFLYYLDGTSFLLKPVAYPFAQRITNVAVGFSHVIAVTVDFDVYSWGDNSRGQLGLEDLLPRTKPVQIESLNGRNIKSAQCGGEFSIFMNENGIVMSCGRGDRGMLGHGNTKDLLKPELIQGVLSHDIHMIECGESHVVMLTRDWKIFVWGSGDCGRLGIGSGDDCLEPTEVTVHSPGARMNESVRDIRCGNDSTVFITEVGRVFACGNNTDNKLGLNRRVTFLMQMKKLLSKNQIEVPCCSIPTPIKELGKHRVVDCFMGATHSVFLTESGLIYAFGRNTEAQLGTGHSYPMDMPNVVKGLSPKPMIVKSMEFATIVASESNSFHIWGSRPVIQSPLHNILPGKDDDQPISPASPDSGFKGSPVHSRKQSSETSYKKKHSPPHTDPNTKVKANRTSVDNDSNHGSPHVRHKSSLEAQLMEIPHEQIPCTVSTKYTQTIRNYSDRHSVNKSIGGKISRQTSIVHNNRITKKGSRESMDKITVTNDGKIQSPISIDLVHESRISGDLWTQGYENIRLEDITCYGPNLVVLIYATLNRKEKTPNVKPPQRKDSFTVGNKLRRSTISAFDLLPEIKPSRPRNLDELKEMNEEEDKGEVVVKPRRPMSPTTELNTWLKNDLKEGIPMPGNGLEESHGWFPTSCDMLPPVEGTTCISDNKKITGNNGTKVLPRRPPSGVDPNAATPSNILNDIPMVTSPTQPTGINRLPSTELKRQISDIEQLQPVSCQPSGGMKLSQANSIAHLPRRPEVTQNIKRAKSNNNVAKPTQDKSTVHDKNSTPSERRASSNQSTAQRRVKLQKSYTTPGKLEDLGKPSPPTKKIKPSTGSPYAQRIMKVKPTVKPPANTTSNGQHQRRRESNSAAMDVKNNEEISQAAFEKEKQELQEIIDKKSENEEKLKAQLSRLTEKVEADQQQFNEFKQKLFELEEEQARVREEAGNKRPQRSKICVVM